jgi:hypothetical protein
MNDVDEASDGGTPPRSTRRRWWLGCGCGCLILLLLALLALAGVATLWRYMQAYAEEVRAMGFEQCVTGQEIQAMQPVTGQTLLWGQFVKIDAGSTTNVAIIAQEATIDGTINGDVYFFGQYLTIGPGATVKGDVHVKIAQRIYLYGSVEGEIEGTYQTLNRQ